MCTPQILMCFIILRMKNEENGRNQASATNQVLNDVKTRMGNESVKKGEERRRKEKKAEREERRM